jgi:hypothetical protein
MWLECVTAMLLALAAAQPQPGVPGRPAPIYTRQTLFAIPFHIARPDRISMEPVEVQLYVSGDRGAHWDLYRKGQPAQGRFLFRAGVDGEYWFAVGTRDRSGQVRPPGPPKPELVVIVDTTPPKLQLTAGRGDAGQITALLEIEEPYPNLDSLLIQYRTGPNSPWQKVAMARQDIHTNGMVHRGEITWLPPAASGLIEVQAAVTDMAGNPAISNAQVALSGSGAAPPPATERLPVVAQRPPAAAAPSASTDAWRPAGPEPQATHWPAEIVKAATAPKPVEAPNTPVNLTPVAVQPPKTPVNVTPVTVETPKPPANPPPVAVAPPVPPANPPPVAVAPPVPPASLPPVAVAPPAPAANAQPVETPKPAEGPKPGEGSKPAGPPQVSLSVMGGQQSQPRADTVAFRINPPGRNLRMVNTRVFELDYDTPGLPPVSSAENATVPLGQAGIGRVELWGTRDGGQTWRSYGVDDRARRAMLVTVDGEGLYGFRIVVQSAGGQGGKPPQNGDLPELWIGVDLTKPTGRITAAEPGTGPDFGKLLISWEAADNQQLAARPIALSQGPTPGGPWTPIASDLENTGHYAWSLAGPLLPPVYLRLEVRDAAGNLGTFETPQPLAIEKSLTSGR